MNNSIFLTLDNGKTAVFTQKTQIVISYSDSCVNSPGLIEKNWCQFASDITIAGISFINELNVSQLRMLCSLDADLKNHDYVVDAICCDSQGINMSFQEIAHTAIVE